MHFFVLWVLAGYETRHFTAILMVASGDDQLTMTKSLVHRGQQYSNRILEVVFRGIWGVWGVWGDGI
jgi:hypothetical protein